MNSNIKLQTNYINAMKKPKKKKKKRKKKKETIVAKYTNKIVIKRH